MTFSIMTLSIRYLYIQLSIFDTQHNNTKCQCAERLFFTIVLTVFMMSVIMLTVFMMSVIMLTVFMLCVILLNVILLNVVAP
jgi:hypothetical protein